MQAVNRGCNSVLAKSALVHSLRVGAREVFEQVEILDSTNVVFMEARLLNASQET